MMRGRLTEHGSIGSHNLSISKSKSKKNNKCHYCVKKEYLKRDCWNLKNNEEAKEKGPKTSRTQGCVARTSNYGEIVYNDQLLKAKNSFLMFGLRT